VELITLEYAPTLVGEVAIIIVAISATAPPRRTNEGDGEEVCGASVCGGDA